MSDIVHHGKEDDGYKWTYAYEGAHFEVEVWRRLNAGTFKRVMHAVQRFDELPPGPKRMLKFGTTCLRMAQVGRL